MVTEVRGMARRPFDPEAKGLSKTTYVQGDVLDRAAIDRLVEGADVVVHLAFLIFGNPKQSREINLTGSRNVFEATAASGAKRLVYTSSVAAYGFHESNPLPLHEDLGPGRHRGLLLLRAEGGARGHAPGGAGRERRGGVRVPALDRRRP